MGDGFRVDVAAMRQVESLLRNRADAMGEAPSALGGAPDAGRSTAEVARVLGVFSDAAVEVAEGLEFAAENLGRTLNDYGETDVQVRSSLDQIAPGDGGL
ncbi:MAG: hypothetical protein ACRDPT_06690 [Streptomycetales bacterium]